MGRNLMACGMKYDTETCRDDRKNLGHERLGLAGKFRSPETIRDDSGFKIREHENPACEVRPCNRTLSVPSAGPRHDQRSLTLQYLQPRRFQQELLFPSRPPFQI